MLKKKLDANQYNLKDQVVAINRVTKVVKGGKNMSFAALVWWATPPPEWWPRFGQGQGGSPGDSQGNRGGQEEPDPGQPDRDLNSAPGSGRFAPGRCC